MKYHNLVYCKHHATDSRAYLYELPFTADIKVGDRLSVVDKHGEHMVTAFSRNFIVGEELTRVICEANGGYYPAARVVGKVETITIQQDFVRPFEEG